MNYMDDLLTELSEQLHLLAFAGSGDDEREFAVLERKLLERIKTELVKSFKNGIERGRHDRGGTKTALTPARR